MPFPAKMSLLAILLLFVGVGNKIGEIAFSVLFWPDQTNPFKKLYIIFYISYYRDKIKQCLTSTQELVGIHNDSANTQKAGRNIQPTN